MSVETVRVALPGRDYDIRIGRGLDWGAEIASLLRGARAAIVTDERVATLHLDALQASLRARGVEAPSLVLPAGEGTKCWRELERTVEWLLEQRIERGDAVIALGGGVIGDLAGFASAILRRGVRLIQMPTTLLAQVDSSVGGKTGINSPHGKNLIGAFHQPSLVLCDTGMLNTLLPRDWLAGYGEVVKYGLLGDAAFFEWLEEHGPVLPDDPDALGQAVARCCAMKAGIVERDERETGERAYLNLGHTFGHALEAATGYSDRLLHGEGVAIGCVLALTLSSRLGHSPQEDAPRVAAHLERMGMPHRLSDIPGDLPPAEALLDLMRQDKKVVGGRLRFVLTRGIGEAFVAEDVPEEAVLDVLREGLPRPADQNGISSSSRSPDGPP